jgi:hypothetical protein
MANLPMRMHMRCFTRLTKAFSKKFENHCHMDFIRISEGVARHAAMAAIVSD